MDLESIAKQVQTYFKKTPLVILGSGSSIPYGLPSMGDLAKEICSKIDDKDLCLISLCEFLKQEKNLEQAINDANLTPEARKKVIEIIWNKINDADLRFLEQLKNEQFKEEFYLVELFQKFIEPSPEKLTIVTTNYDRVAEYAADIVGANIVTGFKGLYLQNFQENFENKQKKVVKILKVHGSLDWVITKNDEVISIPLSKEISQQCSPCIVPPGKMKEGHKHQDPFRTIISEADTEFTSAVAYLSIGYGFNDEHIQPKLLRQIKFGNKPIVILVKERTEKCKEIFQKKSNIKYMIFELSGENKTIVHLHNQETPIEIDGEYWKLENFLKLL